VTTDNLTNTSAEIEKIDLRLQALEEEKSRLLSRKTELESATTELAARPTTLSAKEKVALFQKLFGGRDDIFALRWENKAGKSGYALACHNEWHAGLCNKPRIKCGECSNKAFKTLDVNAIYGHLSGKQTIGLYPLLLDDSCQLLVVDFDKSDWQQATRAFADVCNEFARVMVRISGYFLKTK
jgi:hypothetical protein